MFDGAEGQLYERRERVFLILASLFIGAMTLLNVVGITKFIQLGPLSVAVGVLPYPLTFLCTDLISELYGKKRATLVVWVGLLINIFVISIMMLGQYLPSVGAESAPPWQTLLIGQPTPLPNGAEVSGPVDLFYFIYSCTAGAVVASMVAYLLAQFCDVYLFHFWKKLTRGRHLWLRNNGSTMVSQLVDSVTVIGITFGAVYLDGKMTLNQIMLLMGSNYLFKFSAALLDTIPFYLCVKYLGRYLKLTPQD